MDPKGTTMALGPDGTVPIPIFSRTRPRPRRDRDQSLEFKRERAMESRGITLLDSKSE